MYLNDQSHDQEYHKTFRKRRYSFVRVLLIGIVFTLVTLFGSAYLYLQHLNAPPANFPLQRTITIEPGTDVRTITESFQEAGVVRSSTLLYFTLLIFHDTAAIKASTYVFTEPMTTAAVATRLTEGDFSTDLIRFTHIEGESVSKMAGRAAATLPEFNATAFQELATPYEGKLFPETYFIPASFTEQELLDLMLETFEARVASLQSSIDQHPLSLEEILVLASIIEREASTPESMRLVSSVLQNRLEIGMALQADASIEYVLDKPLSQLTASDLEIDSPYNTYKYPGLPPTPIGNPGLEAIQAVLEPTLSDYFYYITDEEGVFHYAETYSEHLRNIERYLR